MNAQYEIVNIETPFDFANHYISFDLKFNKKDFDSLLRNIDLNKFEKVNYNDLGFKINLNIIESKLKKNKKFTCL